MLGFHAFNIAALIAALPEQPDRSDFSEVRSADVQGIGTGERRALGASELRFTEADGKATISGYAARFNTPSHPIAVRGKKFVETIAPGAFTQALAAGENTVLRTEHRDLPLADTATGTLRLAQDDKGLAFEADLDPTDPDVQRIMPKLRRGTLRDMSFAFNVARSGDRWEMRNGTPHRTLVDIAHLEDVAVVAKPAYPETSIAVRSLEAWSQTPEGRAAATGSNSNDGDGDELADATQPAFAEGALVIVTARRYNARTGVVGSIAEARAGAPPYYSLAFGAGDSYDALPDKWYAEDEIEAAPTAVKPGDMIASRSSQSIEQLRNKLALSEIS
jgi:hypothetical protein